MCCEEKTLLSFSTRHWKSMHYRQNDFSCIL